MHLTCVKGASCRWSHWSPFGRQTLATKDAHQIPRCRNPISTWYAESNTEVRVCMTLDTTCRGVSLVPRRLFTNVACNLMLSAPSESNNHCTVAKLPTLYPGTRAADVAQWAELTWDSASSRLSNEESIKLSTSSRHIRSSASLPGPSTQCKTQDAKSQRQNWSAVLACDSDVEHVHGGWVIIHVLCTYQLQLQAIHPSTTLSVILSNLHA